MSSTIDNLTSTLDAAAAHRPPPAAGDRLALSERFRTIRSQTERLCEPLAIEDMVIQSMPDVSPTKWHLAHTSWFFEEFVLRKMESAYRSLDTEYGYLFNSYYNLVGKQFARPQRGLLSRPTVEEVRRYRAHVDEHMTRLLESLDEDQFTTIAPVIEIGLQHEQQHQELLLTDVKHVLSMNPLAPTYRAAAATDALHDDRRTPPLTWREFDEGLREIGFGGGGFAYDMESPRHRVFIHRFELASRLVTNAEYLDFIRDGGYAKPELWLSEGWCIVQERGWNAPLYWQERDGEWMNFTLSGLREVHPSEPVTHISLFEADAYARWRGLRLPTEAEWETAAASVTIEGNFVEEEHFHPRRAPGTEDDSLVQLFGDAWEWTASPFVAYPGYTPPPGALGEYNGKFMCNQTVLRGGSCATPRSHIRPTYRNFFPPEARWQFAGIRLARTI